ncbi:MAG TPA: carboxypeptidase-like regulatory domain-containing protein [Cyclobacteriaceae bacterium]|jgi:hypothetical protein|nr:carboxypeptidase-like regulatory domain-containing protein [Cyclobacteriaceae bacterium]
MKALFAILTIFSIPFLCDGQTRSLRGKVISESDLSAMPEVKIQTGDKVVLGTTDVNGNFKIDIPTGTDELMFVFIGMEITNIKLPTDCSNLEVIMMVDAIYDYTSVNKINKKRYSLFKKLPEKHHQAHQKGIFTSATPCFSYIFQKYK